MLFGKSADCLNNYWTAAWAPMSKAGTVNQHISGAAILEACYLAPSDCCGPSTFLVSAENSAENPAL